jgi:hypothetical protein
MYFGMDNPLGPSLWSFPKADLVAATPTIANGTWFGVMDYALRGEVLQIANCFDGSSVGEVLATSDLGYDSDPHSGLISFAVQNASGPGATLTSSTVIPTPSWTVPDNPYLGVPQFSVVQPDGTDTLVANDARLSAKVYTVGGVLYAVHNTDLNSHVAIRWYRIRASDHALLESGTIADPDMDLIFPSIAANPYGVIVIGFNGCGGNNPMGCYAIAGQTVSGLTTFGDRLLLQASSLSYHDLGEVLLGNETSRWGDYTTTSVDPSDPTRFWTIQMYPSAIDPTFDCGIWSTRITELITTPPPPLLTINKTGTNVALSWPTGLTGFQLQSATNLTSSVTWSNVTQIPQTNGAQVSVLLPASSSRQFFRLKK